MIRNLLNIDKSRIQAGIVTNLVSCTQPGLKMELGKLLANVFKKNNSISTATKCHLKNYT